MLQGLKKIIIEALHEVRNEPGPFNCNHCPRNADAARGAWCPAWGSILLTELSNGKTVTRVAESCYFERMEKWHEGIREMASINVDSLNEVRRETSAASYNQNQLLLAFQEVLSNKNDRLKIGKSGQEKILLQD